MNLRDVLGLTGAAALASLAAGILGWAAAATWPEPEIPQTKAVIDTIAGSRPNGFMWLKKPDDVEVMINTRYLHHVTGFKQGNKHFTQLTLHTLDKNDTVVIEMKVEKFWSQLGRALGK